MRIGSVVALTGAAIIGTAAVAAAYPGQQLAGQATVTLAQARSVALGLSPGGAIVSQELEKEAGGSGLRYSFDIKTKTVVREIGIDAKTGTVLENSVEKPAAGQEKGEKAGAEAPDGAGAGAEAPDGAGAGAEAPDGPGGGD